MTINADERSLHCRSVIVVHTDVPVHTIDKNDNSDRAQPISQYYEWDVTRDRTFVRLNPEDNLVNVKYNRKIRLLGLEHIY